VRTGWWIDVYEDLKIPFYLVISVVYGKREAEEDHKLLNLYGWTGERQASPFTHTPESMSPVRMLEKGFLPFKAQMTTVCTTELNWWRVKWTTAPQLPLSESIRHSLYIKMVKC